MPRRYEETVTGRGDEVRGGGAPVFQNPSPGCSRSRAVSDLLVERVVFVAKLFGMMSDDSMRIVETRKATHWHPLIPRLREDPCHVMTVRPARRHLAVAVLVLALVAACGPADDLSPSFTPAESIRPGIQADSGGVGDTARPSEATTTIPPEDRAASRPEDDSSRPSVATTSLPPDIPPAEPDSGSVDDPMPDPSSTAADSTAAPPVSPGGSADDPDSLPAEVRSLIGSWHSAVLATSGVWPGFDLASIPTVLVAIDEGGAVRATVAFNHPNPLALGIPIRSLDVDGHEITVIGEVADPDWLAARDPYDFFADVGGTDTFVLISQEGEFGRESGTPEFIAMLVHEAFHRYQWDEWRPGTADQYVDRYDFSAANLELVLLENRILGAAYRADDSGDLERLARQFAAVRATRRQRDFRVAHDEAQERTEGSARFVEHLIGKAIGHAYYMSTGHTGELDDYDRNLADPELQRYGIKIFFSFYRFYSSGATLLVLLERLGVSDVVQQLQDGRTPARLLERHLAPLGDLDELVAGARADHDPDDRLAAAAATLHELALDEPATGLGHDDSEFILTDAQIGCLKAFGIEFSDTPVFGSRVGIPPNPAHSCLVEAESRLTDAQIDCLEAHGIEMSDTPWAGERISIPQNVVDECLAAAGHSDGTSL